MMLPVNRWRAAPDSRRRSQRKRYNQTKVNSPDVIIAGAGLVGVSTALELHDRGADVLVLERGGAGCEASSEAAGMLAATDPETPPALRVMALESARIYPEWIAKLERSTGLETDFRRHGAIVLGEEDPPPTYRKLSEEELLQIEPGIIPSRHAAFSVEEDSVDPVLLMRSVVRAAELSGIQIRTGVTVRRMRWSGSNVEVETSAGLLKSKIAVNCLGAWSGAPVRPRKGQMMYVQPQRAGLLRHVVRAPGAYIVPRSSGKILVGTTLEDVGFDKSVQSETIRAMHAAAAEYLPELQSANIVETWAGLRPGSPDDLPLLGPTEERNVILASGLFRNGILLAPVTARIAAQLVMGNPAGLDISAFSPGRFAAASASLS